MDTNRSAVTRRRAGRRALTALRLALAAALVASGYGLLYVPQVVDDLTGGGIAHEPRLLLGVFHVAGGLGLLVPALAEPTSVVLGLLMGGVAVSWLAAGRVSLAVAPTFASLALFALGAGTRLRRCAAAASWRALLRRFAEEDTSPNQWIDEPVT